MLVYTYIGCILPCCIFLKFLTKVAVVCSNLSITKLPPLLPNNTIFLNLSFNQVRKRLENGFSGTYSPCFQISSLETLGNQNPVYEEVSEVDLPFNTRLTLWW